VVLSRKAVKFSGPHANMAKECYEECPMLRADQFLPRTSIPPNPEDVPVVLPFETKSALFSLRKDLFPRACFMADGPLDHI